MPTLRPKTIDPWDMPVGKPHYHPSLPGDLGEITDDQLMDLFNQFTQWANYTSVVLAGAEVESCLAVPDAWYQAGQG
jgi:hypothetical protein